MNVFAQGKKCIAFTKDVHSVAPAMRAYLSADSARPVATMPGYQYLPLTRTPYAGVANPQRLAFDAQKSVGQ